MNQEKNEERIDLDRMLAEMAQETPEMPADFHARWTEAVRAEAGQAKTEKKQDGHRQWRYILSAAAVFVFCGVRAFVRRSIGDYMFLRSQFVFFDFDEPISRFFLDYILVMILFACLGHYLMLMLRRLKV